MRILFSILFCFFVLSVKSAQSVTVMADTNGELKAPLKLMQVNILPGTNVSFTTNGGKLTISATSSSTGGVASNVISIAAGANTTATTNGSGTLVTIAANVSTANVSAKTGTNESRAITINNAANVLGGNGFDLVLRGLTTFTNFVDNMGNQRIVAVSEDGDATGSLRLKDGSVDRIVITRAISGVDPFPAYGFIELKDHNGDTVLVITNGRITAISGNIFSGSGDLLTGDDVTYDASGWNSNLTLPTKNAVRDKIESLVFNSDIRSVGPVATNSVASTNSTATDIVFADLATVTNLFAVADCETAWSVSSPCLTVVGGAFISSDFVVLTNSSFPSLSFVGGLFYYGGTHDVPSLPLPSLQAVGGDFFIIDNDSLDTVTLPSLVTIVGNVLVVGSGFGSPVATFTASQWLPTDATSITFSDCALTASSVNHILARCVAAGVTQCTIDLSTGSSAAPTGQGITDKAALITAGNSVTTN